MGSLVEIGRDSYIIEQFIQITKHGVLNVPKHVEHHHVVKLRQNCIRNVEGDVHIPLALCLEEHSISNSKTIQDLYNISPTT